VPLCVNGSRQSLAALTSVVVPIRHPFPLRPAPNLSHAFPIALTIDWDVLLGCGRPFRRSRIPPLVRSGHRSTRSRFNTRSRPPAHAAVLTCHKRGPTPIACEILPSILTGPSSEYDCGPIDPNILAGRLNHLCAARGIRVMVLDGPQAWKSRTNGFDHSRVSERQLNTAAKTGCPAW